MVVFNVLFKVIRAALNLGGLYLIGMVFLWGLFLAFCLLQTAAVAILRVPVILIGSHMGINTAPLFEKKKKPEAANKKKTKNRFETSPMEDFYMYRKHSSRDPDNYEFHV